VRIAVYENLPLGGARRLSFELGRRLAERHQVDLYRLNCFRSPEMDLARHVRRERIYEYAPALGLLRGRIESGRFGPRSYTCFGPLRRLHRRLAAELHRGGYDAVLVHTDAMTQSPYLLRYLSGDGSAYFCHEPLRIVLEPELMAEHRRRLAHSWGPLGALRRFEDGWAWRRLAGEDQLNVRAARLLIVNSEHSRREVQEAYGRDSQVCLPGVDPGRFRPDPEVVPRPEVLSIGSPVEAKGHPAVIEALARLPAAGRPRLRVILPRPLGGEDLAALAAARGVELHLEVGVREDTLLERYRSALALVCAARREPFGLTVLEAMACGTPVVAVRSGGFLESVADGETGLLVEPGPAALAEAIGRLAGDRRLRQRLGRHARERAVSWTWERSAGRLEELLVACTG
jgi:glycosyltransferase involved in cell wall biosynthesis